MHIPEETKTAIDNITALGVLGTVMDVLPAIVAALALIWYLIRIYEWARVRIFGKQNDGVLK